MLKNRHIYSAILFSLLCLKTNAKTRETRTVSFKGVASQVKMTSIEISQMSEVCSYDENYCTENDRLFTCKFAIKFPMFPTTSFRFPEGHLIESGYVDKEQCSQSLKTWLSRNQGFPISAVITEVKETSIYSYLGNCIKEIGIGYTAVINNEEVAGNGSRVGGGVTSTKVDPIFCKQ